MTDPREALSRLIRWKAEGLFGDGTPYPDARLDKSQFYADVVALLSLVEKQQDALDRAEKLLTADLSVLRMGPDGDGFSLETAGRMVAVIAGELATWLREHHAENYTETAFEQIEVSGGCKRYIVTVQRGDGKSPHQLRKEAEAERDALSLQVARLKERVDTIRELATGFDRTDIRSCQLRIMSIAQEAADALSSPTGGDR